MVAIGERIFLLGIVGMVVCKNRGAKNDWGIEEGVVGGDCTDGFVSE